MEKTHCPCPFIKTGEKFLSTNGSHKVVAIGFPKNEADSQVSVEDSYTGAKGGHMNKLSCFSR